VKDWYKISVARRGPEKRKKKSPLQIYNVGTPFERDQMDILGPLSITLSENKYLLE